ncbi:MAG: hypothetical protein RL318_691 [Fibrobacterota bacterium]|jgi:uncharacterized protein (TIGR00255 family)
MGQIRSMTGFGTGEVMAAGRKVIVEVRSVNGRFLEAQLRMPRLIQPLEGALREALSGKLGRGSVTVTVNLEDQGGRNGSEEGNSRWVRLAQELRAVKDATGLAGEITVSDLLGWASINKTEAEPEPALEEFKPAVFEALALAMQQHDAFRLKEGENLKADLLGRLQRIEAALVQIPALAREHIENYRVQLQARIQEMVGGLSVDPARLAQEVAHLADKLDVDEEMTRFSSHNGQFRDCLEAGGAVGKRMGFLLQEMLREANTTGSKCQNARISHLVISIKDELESLKEQIANLE